MATHIDDQFEPFRDTGFTHTPGGHKILGAFIATTDAQESAWVLSRAPRMEDFFTRLLKLDRQVVYALFRYCGLPRWNHIIRCHAPEVTMPANELVDKYARRCLMTLLGCGSGAGNLLFDNPLFTGDLLASIPFSELAPLAWKAATEGVDGVANAPMQHDLVAAHLVATRAGLIPTSGASPVARVHASLLLDVGSRRWLECYPSRAEYAMRRMEYEIALRARYLLPPSNEETHYCVCGRQFEPELFVVHALDCNKVRGYTWASRHALVKRVFKSVLRQYGFNPDEAEPRFFGGGTGPDVCFLLGGRLTLVDVVVTNPLADTYVDAELASPGATLLRAEKEKDRRSIAPSEVRRMDFFPLALTTFGNLGPRSTALLHRCSSFTADPPGFMKHMGMALSIAVQIGNANIIKSAKALWTDFGVR